MTDDLLRTILETAEAKQDKDGFHALPEGRSLTLYGAHNGVSLTVAKVTALSLAGDVIRAKSAKGQMFVLGRSVVFAANVEGMGDTPATRKAGFVT